LEKLKKKKKKRKNNNTRADGEVIEAEVQPLEKGQ